MRYGIGMTQEPKAPAKQRPIEPQAFGTCEDIDHGQQNIDAEINRSVNYKTAIAEKALHHLYPI